MSEADDDRGGAGAAERPVYGTSERDAPATRAELERALRFVNLGLTDAREDILRLAAQVVTLTAELAKRPGGEELEAQVEAGTPARYQDILGNDEAAPGRVTLSPAHDKYAVVGPEVPCLELLPICKGRCCTMVFSLTTQDLDEGIVRWDYGKPYEIRQRESDGYCVHNDPTGHGCTIHEHRPGTCRRYSCATDKRVWADFDKRILAAPEGQLLVPGKTPPGTEPFDLHERVRQRQLSLTLESSRVHNSKHEGPPTRGPAPPPRAK